MGYAIFLATRTRVDALPATAVHCRAEGRRQVMAEKGRETMGQRLQRLRQGTGMSQFELAKTADVPIGTIRNWEQDLTMPRFDTAFRVAKALCISLDDLAAAMPQRTPKKLRGKKGGRKG